MSAESREYAKFKREFVGPKIPKKVQKERGIWGTPPMPGDKPIVYKTGNRKGPPSNADDFRSVRLGNYLKHHITPRWANKLAIKEIYKDAERITEETGIKHQVDHIIPIRSPLVCGLHVENNLRIITAEENSSKSNSFVIV
jgi:hypothetical protein